MQTEIQTHHNIHIQRQRQIHTHAYILSYIQGAVCQTIRQTNNAIHVMCRHTHTAERQRTYMLISQSARQTCSDIHIAYIHSRIHTCINTYIPAGNQAYKKGRQAGIHTTYSNTGMGTYKQTYIQNDNHTNIDTYTQ